MNKILRTIAVGIPLLLGSYALNAQTTKIITTSNSNTNPFKKTITEDKHGMKVEYQDTTFRYINGERVIVDIDKRTIIDDKSDGNLKGKKDELKTSQLQKDTTMSNIKLKNFQVINSNSNHTEQYDRKNKDNLFYKVMNQQETKHNKNNIQKPMSEHLDAVNIVLGSLDEQLRILENEARKDNKTLTIIEENGKGKLTEHGKEKESIYIQDNKGNKIFYTIDEGVLKVQFQNKEEEKQDLFYFKNDRKKTRVAYNGEIELGSKSYETLVSTVSQEANKLSRSICKEVKAILTDDILTNYAMRMQNVKSSLYNLDGNQIK